MAIEPTAENPVRNFPASIQPLARLLPPYMDDDPESACPKNSHGMGTSTYMKAAYNTSSVRGLQL